jgi:photosystem II stability/assembly factor-like uncharacterized protein
MKTITASASALLIAAFGTAAFAAPTAPASPVVDSSVVSGLGARNIGSATMSGRIAAIDAVWRDGKLTLFVGSASGGVWKSMDGGTTFRPMFDKQDVQSIGAVTIDRANPNTIWVGTGESWTRNSVSVGDGVYKSTDGGQSWTNMGLPNSERISKILIDPTNSDTVYVCAPGKLWSDSADRGLYKTTDGGKSWTLILKGSNLSTGCASIAMDPKDPNVILAGLWDFRRTGWNFRSGGNGPDAPSGSAMMRTSDGGKTWTKMDASTNPGLPKGPWGRMAIAYAPSDNNIVYAMIENVRSALYRSDDGGKTWQERDRSQSMVWRPFYFANLIVDPTNPNRLFKPDLNLIVSEDGGKSFSSAAGGMHGDNHTDWIDPKNPQHLIAGDDGGLWYSEDGGNLWRKANNLPVSQFYHVSADNKDPYQVYGGLQDNSDWVGDSEYPGGITNSRWENLLGGDGFWAYSDPSDPNFAYAESQGGHIARIDRLTHDTRDIQPKGGYKEKLRYNWNTPIATSPNDPSVLYIGAQFLFRTRDHGQSWDRISPDLTTNDPERQKQELSGGITVDNSAAETNTTIYSISESPKDKAEIWVGTDDGNVQVTRDGGGHWSNVVGNIKGLPKGEWTSWVEASRYDPAVAYAAFDRHTFGDMDPYLYKTSDYGKTWTRIASPGQGVRGYVHVIREDRLNPNILFMGTEFGLWISLDGGKGWAQFKGGDMPDAAVRDLVVQPQKDDLVIATHGRGIWIIDDISPLRALTPETLGAVSTFLPGRPTVERIEGNGGWAEGDATFTGQNPAGGATITYYQRARHVFGKLKIEVLNDKGEVIDTLPASVRKGINRVTWSMRARPPRVPTAAQIAFASTQGPRVVPGVYTIRMTDNGKVTEEKVNVGLDPRETFTVADRQAQYDAVLKARDLFDRMSDLVDHIKGLQMAAGKRMAGLPDGDPLKAQLASLIAQSGDQLKEIVATKEGGAITGEIRIRENADDVYGALMSYEGAPAAYQMERVAGLSRELDDVQHSFEAMVAKSVPPINDALTKKGLPPLTPAAMKQALAESQPNPLDRSSSLNARATMVDKDER